MEFPVYYFKFGVEGGSDHFQFPVRYRDGSIGVVRAIWMERRHDKMATHIEVVAAGDLIADQRVHAFPAEQLFSGWTQFMQFDTTKLGEFDLAKRLNER